MQKKIVDVVSVFPTALLLGGFCGVKSARLFGVLVQPRGQVDWTS